LSKSGAPILLTLLLVPLALPRGVDAQSTHLTLTVAGQSLVAGFNNNVTLVVTNAYYSTIYDVDLELSIPTPLALIGGNRWRYDSLGLGQTVRVDFQIYAPTSAIGNSYQATFSATYKQLGDVSSTEESHSVSFSVQGWVSLIIYGIQVSPSSVPPGGNASVSGSLLNRGNVAAYNANVTVESDALRSSSAASVYLGQVDPNIPRPFSLLISLRADLAEGSYILVVKVSAIDNERPWSPYSAQGESQIQVKKAISQPQVSRSQDSGPLALLLRILRYLFNLFFGSVYSVGSFAPTAYSYLNATTAFIRAARQAG